MYQILASSNSLGGDFHARSRFARPTIPEEKWGTTRSLAIRRCFATLSENVTITSDAFIDMGSYFDMSNLSFAAW